MDKPIGETKRISGRKVRGNREVGQIIRHSRGDATAKPRRMAKRNITKEEFLTNLGKVCQPISKESAKSDLEKSET